MTWEAMVRAQLEGDEGRVKYAYKDSEGLWTIGVGRLIDRRGGGLSDPEIDYLFSNDLASKEAYLDEKLPWWRKLDDARRAVLVNMAFQLGGRGLEGFVNMLRAAAGGQWSTAADEILNSHLHAQTPDRCERMASQMRSGLWRPAPGVTLPFPT